MAYKIILTLVIAAVILIAAFYALNAYIYHEKQAESNEQQYSLLR